MILTRVKQWLANKWCDLAHKKDHIKLPLYKAGTYEIVGTGLFCKRCI